MFVYLSKKLAIPNNIPLRAIGWNKTYGYIACGGDDGMLKVLKLEPDTSKDPKAKGLAAPSNLSMNQPLEGHSGAIRVIAWNENFQKLTTSDKSGLIIVWVLYKDYWYEEMINSRDKSTVTGMKWDADGNRVCIVYEDGAVIVGSVDGNRIWGKDLKGFNLSLVEWSPDGKLLLFGLNSAEVHIYDSGGNFINKLAIYCLENSDKVPPLIALEWYSGALGWVEQNCACLAVAFANGRLQLMRNEVDEAPIVLATHMTSAVQAAWNHDGSMLAIAGTLVADDQLSNAVLFFSPFGQHLRTLKVPGKELSGCAWEGGGLRIALAVDSFIFFANIRPTYKWGYCTNTIVYAFTQPDRFENGIMFWDINRDEHHLKYVSGLVALQCCQDSCCFLSKTTDDSGQYALVLCNTLGTPLDSKYIDMQPTMMSMSDQMVVAACKEAFYCWQFRNPRKQQLQSVTDLAGRRRFGFERLYHVDDIPTGASADNSPPDFTKAFQPTGDPICALCAGERTLLVGRDSGTVNLYSLPLVSLLSVHHVPCRPARLYLNCNATRFAVIDPNGTAYLYNLSALSTDDAGREQAGALMKFERKDVWDFCWATDNAEMFALMEKTRMYIFRDTEPEEPLSSSAHICEMSSLTVRAVYLDQVLRAPLQPSKEWLLEHEVKSLRDTRDLLEKVGLPEALQFVEQNSHVKLWRLLAEHALNQLNLKVAETAFVKCLDYQGIEFVKRLSNMQADNMKKAEIAAYFNRFDDAERLYVEMDRKDLAIMLRRKLGDHFRVLQLLKSGVAGGGDDVQMQQTNSAIGQYYFDRQKHREAATYFQKANNAERLADCYYKLEEYELLAELAKGLPDSHKYLPRLGAMFASIGMCDAAVDAFSRCGQIKLAVDTCIQLNQWMLAIKLAKQHQVKDIDTMLAQCVAQLLKDKRELDAVELYRMSGNYVEAARLIVKLATEERDRAAQRLGGSHVQRMKKLYVLAGLLMSQHHGTGRSGKEAAASAAALLADHGAGDASAQTRMVDNAWRGAEAYHFYMLAQRQLFRGHTDAAMRTAFALQNYDGIIPVHEAYSLLALTAVGCKAFGVASDALMRLENFSADEAVARAPDADSSPYELLAMEIFARHSPKDAVAPAMVECSMCATRMPEWQSTCPSCATKVPVCVASGRPIHARQTWACQRCKHMALPDQIHSFHFCPLCHESVM